MHHLRRAFFVALVSLPLVAFGATPPAGTSAPSCIKPGETATLGSVEAVKTQAQDLVTCSKDTCSDERVTLTRYTFSATVKDEVTRACKTPEDKKKYGCGPGQIKPKVVIVMGDGETSKSFTVSKCDPNALKSALSKSIDGKTTQPLQQLESQQAESLKAPPAINAGTDALASALTDLGIPGDQARTIANSAVSAGDLIKALQSNDPNAIGDAVKKAAADAGVTINPDLFDSIKGLTPEQAAAKLASLAGVDITPKSGDTTFKPDTGADTSALGAYTSNFPTQCGIEGIAGNIMRAESSCGRINYNPRSSVQGPYHFLCDTWTSYARGTGYGNYADCSYRNDPAISTQVMNAKLDQYAQTYGNTCTQAGLTVTSCQYAIHVFGEGGFRNIFNAYLANGNASAYSLCGSALRSDACSNNSSIFRNGGTVAGVFSELDRRLGGTSIIASIANPAAAPFSTAMNALNALSSGNLASLTSPFGDVTPGYSLMQRGRPAQYAQPSGQQQQTQGGSSEPSQSFPGQTAQFPTQTGGPVVQPAAILIAQPKTVARGSSIQVSWSTVGMRPDVPCRVLINEVFLLAEGNEGTKFATTTASTTVGPWTFTLECMALTGAAVRQTASVDIR